MVLLGPGVLVGGIVVIVVDVGEGVHQRAQRFNDLQRQVVQRLKGRLQRRHI